MATLKNVNPLGAVDVPLVGRTIEAGEVFDVPESVAAVLLEQVGNYEPAKPVKNPPAVNDAPEGVK